ncbi:DDB1- and CUL4-associated factor 13-like [Anneissia japonica]|uniref:DDB1- and CUL4-associated factor 13-like n=1 Tax=Anneissia japonica TaxID=1529436 RepID=UPI001425854D|nr:DDB1- and CUL4-associated factor 13-like [Anneissia japonica]XP_033116004.1 DDB1- and CUL4-associated factor 13-like [Anneissia japonica]XP_033116005.1 DDB1- and CUL4-associated factor 13-like [Anneissia japonica]XP_033116006.1 DDB1- and CUL4-associated factor 13-like [Anneissia japonica]
MKVKVLCRNPDDYVRETKKDIQRVHRNYDPSLHPFEAPREYVRALNATKLERVFAKPFLGSLDGHTDSVHCMAKHPTSLSTLLSGSCDGEVKIWNLASRKCTKTLTAHTGFVRSLCVESNANYFLSVGDDQTVKQWSMSCSETESDEAPVNTIIGKTIFIAIDHHWRKQVFVTSGQKVDLWDINRTEPLRSFTWGTDSIHSVKFNPIEVSVFGSCTADRNIILYDMRANAPLKKVIMSMKTNTIAWNPMEPFMFTAANEDYNLYTFDVRRLDHPVNVHMDHVSAVVDVDYSPTGREFVSGSFDKTIRIFPADKGRSREVYHTKRMQHVSCIKWSLDNKYILSGSDEMNVRIWKARAAEKLGKLKKREEAAFQYNEKLKEKYQHHPQIKRIARHRHVPRLIYKETQTIRIQRQSLKRKQDNRRKHSKPGTVPIVSEREKHVVGSVE